ncbi:hypothetical protein VTJ49DRAFT_2113 [Mycothermus thermophilus]|uniref:GPI inositol-deacylase n=1 Tax=Humicola insolens TaxID=85995 RepID=A0ABR3VAK8_HUMIN
MESKSGSDSPSQTPSQDGQSRRSLGFLQRVVSRRRPDSQPRVEAHGSLGLNLLFCPTEPLLELVFVHGLGGGSIKTWCFAEDVTKFWPKEWLPKESGFGNIRIYSYGYDADWQASKSTSTINVHDFGRELLEKIRNSTHILSSTTNPIVFVAHSMGGLVIKQAYVLARQDPSSAELAGRMKAMVFLGTPHRGSDLARTLNRILGAFPGRSSRSYISNLSGQNELLGLLNDSFRHFAPDVSLYSFYESRPTNLGLRSEMIVPKESAILGYPAEGIAKLDADHRHICKFESPSDPNYTSVLEVLRNTTKGILDSVSTKVEETWRDMRKIEAFLEMPARPDDDLGDVEEARVEGSCEWLAKNEAFQGWADPDSADSPVVYWLSANPGTGKSVLAGYVVNTLTNRNLNCSYYFFRHGDKDKSTVGGFLRSLLYQMAQQSTQLRQQFLSLIEKEAQFNKDDPKIIWRQFVRPIVNNPSACSTAHYWVLDALDECSDFETLFTAMGNIERRSRIRILITSRKLPEISQQFSELRGNRRAAITVVEDEISLKHTEADIRLYLEANQHKLHVGNEEQKAEFCARILDKSEYSFLWARIVLEELASAWSISEIQRILEEVPPKMVPLYSRALAIMSSRPPRRRLLTRAILTWIVCAVRPLTVAELREALKLDLEDEIRELEGAIASLCAQLVHIDNTGRAMMIHLTAKEFLTNPELDSEFRIDKDLGHLRLATNCLKFLCSEQMKVPRKLRASSKQAASQFQTRSPFAAYACLEFGEHLQRATPMDDTLSNLLCNFFGANVLSWIEYIATTGNLSVMTRTADSLNTYFRRNVQSSSASSEESVRLAQSWAVDLRRIVARFGPTLLVWPWTIYGHIPPFCPKSSAIVATAGSRFGRITINGLRDEHWNDRIACIDSSPDIPLAVACGDTIFAVAYSSQVIKLYYGNTCLYWKTFDNIFAIEDHLLFNGTNTHLISASGYTMKVLEIDSGSICWQVRTSDIIMTVAVTEDDKTLMAVDMDGNFTAWSIQSGRVEQQLCWRKKMPPPLSRKEALPSSAAFSPAGSYFGVSYLGGPVCVYDVESNGFHGFLEHEDDAGSQLHGRVPEELPCPAAMVFNTNRGNPTIAVAHDTGGVYIFDYKKCKQLAVACMVSSREFLRRQPHLELACSPDGSTLAVADIGVIHLVEFETLRPIYRVETDWSGCIHLSFSTDGLLLFDIRRTQCNVWEPAALLGMRKQDIPSTEAAEGTPIINKMDSDEPGDLITEEPNSDEMSITTIQLTDEGDFFFVGRDDGSVSVFETALGKQRRVLYRQQEPENWVVSLAWGSEKCVIASGKLHGFVVLELTPEPQHGWDVKAKVMEWRGGPTPFAMLFDPSNNFLLVSDETEHMVWDDFNDGLNKRIKRVIGVYGSRVLFLDRQGWVSSVDEGQLETRAYVRHFPIPSDWDWVSPLIMRVVHGGAES